MIYRIPMTREGGTVGARVAWALLESPTLFYKKFSIFLFKARTAFLKQFGYMGSGGSILRAVTPLKIDFRGILLDKKRGSLPLALPQQKTSTEK